MKRMTALFLILTLCIGLLTACGRNKDEIPTEDVELWVVTELTIPYRMNDQANRVIKQFKELYPNVTVKLDILPTDDGERDAYLQKLRTQIMNGDGPDAYLLPTGDSVPESTDANSRYKRVDLLFRDVEQTMYNGLFYDISEYYDADEALNKEELNTSVMDGGVMDGARYVLPLRYDFGVYLVDRENFEAAGGDISVFQKGMDALMAMALELEDACIANAASPGREEYYFGDYLDAASGEVLVTEEEVADFLRTYQQVRSLELNTMDVYSIGAGNYIKNNEFFATSGYAMVSSSFSNLVGALTTAKVVGEELEMYPVLAADGTLNAVIDYYAAVGTGSKYPRLAYEFIRLFLSEEMQYETYMTTKEYSRADYPVWYGWPVRTAKCVAPRLDRFLYQISNSSYRDVSARQRQAKFENPHLTLTEEEIPALTWEVDEVHFPIQSDWGIDLYTFSLALIDWENDYGPTDVDIDALARECIEKLEFHLDEG